MSKEDNTKSFLFNILLHCDCSIGYFHRDIISGLGYFINFFHDVTVA